MTDEPELFWGLIVSMWVGNVLLVLLNLPLVGLWVKLTTVPYWVLLIRCGCEPAPVLLGFVLGPLLEENLRRALLISRGDASVFVTRPISASLLALALGALLMAILPTVRRRRETVFVEDE